MRLIPELGCHLCGRFRSRAGCSGTAKHGSQQEGQLLRAIFFPGRKHGHLEPLDLVEAFPCDTL